MTPESRRVEFGAFVFELSDQTLFCGDKRVPLRPQAARALLYLIENRHRVVLRTELMELLWHGTNLDANQSLNTIIGSIRKTLGDSPQVPSYIETIPTKGFRFIASTYKRNMAWLSNPALRITSFAIAIICGISIVFVLSLSSQHRGLTTLSPATKGGLSEEVRFAFLQGLQAYQAGQRQLSQSYFERTTSMQPDFALGHLWLGKSKLPQWDMNIDDAIEAEPHVLRAVQLNSDLPNAYLLLAYIAIIRHNDVPLAQSFIAKTLALDPTNIEVRILKRNARLAIGDAMGALAEIDKINSIDPLTLVQMGVYGWSMLIAEQYRSAATRCRESLKLAHRIALSHGCLYETYLALDELELARLHAIEVMKHRYADESEVSQISALPIADALHAYWKWNLEYLEGQPSTAGRVYELALTNLRLGRKEESILNLQVIVNQRQYPFVTFIASDPRLKPLRDLPEANLLFSLFQ